MFSNKGSLERNLLISQCFPMKVPWHLHVYPDNLSVQNPLFWHGSLRHSSISVMPGKHIFRNIGTKENSLVKRTATETNCTLILSVIYITQNNCFIVDLLVSYCCLSRISSLSSSSSSSSSSSLILENHMPHPILFF